MVNAAWHFVEVFNALPGIVHTCFELVFFKRSFLVNLSVTRLPDPPLSRRARSVTGLALPNRVLNLTNTMGLRSPVLARFGGLRWPRTRSEMESSSPLFSRVLSIHASNVSHSSSSSKAKSSCLEEGLALFLILFNPTLLSSSDETAGFSFWPHHQTEIPSTSVSSSDSIFRSSSESILRLSMSS